MKPMTALEHAAATAQVLADIAQAAAVHERELAEAKVKLDIQEKELSKISDQMKSFQEQYPIREQIQNIIPGLEDERKVIDKCVWEHSKNFGYGYETSLRKLFMNFKETYHIDIWQRSKNQHKNPIDIVEDLQMLPKLCALAKNNLGFIHHSNWNR